MSWDRRLPLGGGLHLSGFSTGSRASCFLVHELRLYFDAGLAPPVDARTVCVTHCHPGQRRRVDVIFLFEGAPECGAAKHDGEHTDGKPLEKASRRPHDSVQ